MTTAIPDAVLGKEFSSPHAKPTPWDEACAELAKAEVYWLSTVRPDGRPHVTPLIAVWVDDALHFCTGETERKNRNIARNPHVILTTGRNTMAEGLDLVVEGDAARVSDEAKLRRLADAYVAKYGEDWRFSVSDGLFHHSEGAAIAYEVQPITAFGFARGEPGGQTRWRF